MSIQVIGAGFGRTGTLSLKLALEKLGFDKCYHMLEVGAHPEHVAMWQAAGRGEPVDWDALFAGYRATVDWPSCNFYREQMAHYPAARVILSERDPERWYESVMNTIWPSSVARRDAGDPATKPWSDMVFEVIWEGTFNGRIEDKDYALAVYRTHNREVRETVPPDRLLVFDPAEGWEPLCRLLDVPMPAEPFPRVNTTDDFRATVSAMAQGSTAN